MTLVTLSGVISAANLNTNFSDKTSTLLTNMKSGNETTQKTLRVFDLTNAIAASLRTYVFTPLDDIELQGLRLQTYSTNASLVITGTLKAINPDTAVEYTKYLMDQTVTITNTSVVGKSDTHSSFTSPFTVLKANVSYQLQLSSASATACDKALLILLAKVRRRTR
ncbi:MAG: hypothetical protein IPP74_14980 [Alphaproteobacteria bacterium]|nr:hypothetical protein [Alphaproteobacteria bacterium]